MLVTKAMTVAAESLMVVGLASEVPSIGVYTASGGGLLIVGVDLRNDANAILVRGPLGDFGQ